MSIVNHRSLEEKHSTDSLLSFLLFFLNEKRRNFLQGNWFVG